MWGAAGERECGKKRRQCVPQQRDGMMSLVVLSHDSRRSLTLFVHQNSAYKQRTHVPTNQPTNQRRPQRKAANMSDAENCVTVCGDSLTHSLSSLTVRPQIDIRSKKERKKVDAQSAMRDDGQQSDKHGETKTQPTTNEQRTNEQRTNERTNLFQQRLPCPPSAFRPVRSLPFAGRMYACMHARRHGGLL